ncbi:hypothetical protein [Methylopila turkensis]|uniref:Uncharacterized protein n=1 Tax=Methylopila turkensis TaxID=1437816 RepID=A0A9W6JKH5_9HYPH|nr:hypothetical protein [Methylopila turkensis]GLK79306.1 hypothetical protein GCM10008174_10470 [Methylopila turkensis]
MGARLVRAVDWAARLSRAGLALSVAAVALGAARDWGYTVPLDVAIARALDAAAPGDALERRVAAALDAEDVALARGYADLAGELGRPLIDGTRARLAAAEAPQAAAWRNARDAAFGFVTGEANGTAALAGALASDLTVIGDVRDLAREGARMARGEEHSELIMALSAAGLAATAATFATGGGAAPAKFGVSALKAARRVGTLTAEFTADLARRLFRTADARRVGGAEAAGGAAVRATRTGGGALDLRALAATGADFKAASAAAGAAETVRLMRFVRSGDDLADLAPFARRFGARSRAVAELVGRASLRAFRATTRLTELLLEWLGWAIAWFAALAAGAVADLGRRGARLVAARV